jgi:integrase
MAKINKVTSYNSATERVTVSNPFRIVGRTCLYLVVTITDIQSGRQRDLKRSTGIKADAVDSKEKALLAKDRILNEFLSGGIDPTAAITLKQYSLLYIDDRSVEGLSTSAIRGIKSAFQGLTIHVGPSRLLQNITPMDARRFLFHNRTSASVALADYRNLHAAFARAMRDGLIPINIFNQVDVSALRKKFKPRPRGILSPQQVVQIYECLPKGSFRLRTWANFFLTLYGGGLRRAEACFLHINDVELNSRIIKVRPSADHSLKSKASEADIPFTRYSEYAIRDQLNNLAEHPEEAIRLSAVLFPNSNGGAYRPDSLSRVIIPLIKKACGELGINIDGIDLHSLRHSITQLLIDTGAEPAIVSKFVRHGSIATTISCYHRNADIQTKYESILRITNALPAIIVQQQPGRHQVIVFDRNMVLMVLHHASPSPKSYRMDNRKLVVYLDSSGMRSN